VRRNRHTKDEFWLLRPVILFSTGFLVLGIVLQACRQAAEQRARLLAGMRSPAEAGGPPVSSVAIFQVCPQKPLPGPAIEIVAPAVD
jgi:hypothetical protein